MTTLIVHPKIDVQKQQVLELVKKYLELPDRFDSLLDIEHPDLHIIDGTTVSSIGIDRVKQFLRELQYQPYEAEKQIGVILFSDAITKEAQNSLLKTLEEPSEQTEFILTVSHEKKILPTILSRTNIIHIDKTLNDEFESDDFNLNEFLKLDIPEKFKEIEEIVDKDKTERGTVKKFLSHLTHYYREKLIYFVRNNQNKNVYKTSTDLKEISKAIHFISKNTNKRLTLENLILQLEHRII
jgi:DNA polymerase III gamma/tau subunit